MSFNEQQNQQQNRQIKLASRPNGAPTKDNFELTISDIPTPNDKQMLLRTVYMSLDPYMRGRMSASKSYADPLEVGDVMLGGTVAQVVESNIEKFAVGDLVVSNSGWQVYSVSDGEGVLKLDKNMSNLICFALINILELPPGNTEKVFEKLDFLSFAFFASGLAALAVFLVQGRIQWWTTPWLSYPLIIAVVTISIALWIETHRKNPMLQVRWMRSRNIIAFTITGAVMRILLSEQNVGAAGLLANLSYGNDQLITFYAVILAASVLALVISIFRTNAMDLRRPVIFAVTLIAVGAWLDTDISLNSAPYMFYVSQFMIAFAAVYFMGPMVFEGMFRAIANGPAYIISFSVIFSISQTIGGLAGAAAIQAFTTIRTQMHYADMVSSFNLGNPALMAQVADAGRILSTQITDANQANVAAMGQVLQSIQRQATVAAYADLFFLMATIASITTLILLLNYLYHRYHKRNPLAKELAAIAKMREAK